MNLSIHIAAAAFTAAATALAGPPAHADPADARVTLRVGVAVTDHAPRHPAACALSGFGQTSGAPVAITDPGCGAQAPATVYVGDRAVGVVLAETGDRRAIVAVYTSDTTVHADGACLDPAVVAEIREARPPSLWFTLADFEPITTGQ